MVKKLRRPSRKELMLAAAAELVAAQGIQALTIDAMAKATGTTKGGIQYHFSTKEQLVDELLLWMLDQFSLEVEDEAGKLTGPCRWLKAYVRCLSKPITGDDRVVLAILSDFRAEDPRLSQYRTRLQHWRTRGVEDGMDPELALIVQLAAENLWTDRLYGSMTAKQAKSVAAKLLTMIDDSIGIKKKKS